MQNNQENLKIAQSDSWKTKDMPETVASLTFSKTYTHDEFSVLTYGLIPREMEDKWFVFMQDNTLFFHRSWTGICIYKIFFEQRNTEYVVTEALVNQDPEQYKSTDKNYEIALLSWLIDCFLLHKRVPFPLPKDLPEVDTPGLFQHHVSGTGYPEI